MTMEEVQKKREEKAAAARQEALDRSMLAIQQEEVKAVELLPRKIWRAEWFPMDENRIARNLFQAMATAIATSINLHIENRAGCGGLWS